MRYLVLTSTLEEYKSLFEKCMLQLGTAYGSDKYAWMYKNAIMELAVTDLSIAYYMQGGMLNRDAVFGHISFYTKVQSAYDQRDLDSIYTGLTEGYIVVYDFQTGVLL